MVTRASAIVLMLGALLVACQGDEEAIEFVEPGVTGDWDDCIDWELLPICGDPVPELGQLDLTVQSYMLDNNISAGSVGVIKDGHILFEHGFGWSTRNHSEPVHPDALFRVASVTKSLTAAAVHDLIDEGLLSLDTHVFDLGQPGGGVLALEPFGGLGDSRLEDVTIQHLLEHKGGWDKNLTKDYTFKEVFIAAAMSVSSPPGRENVARFMLGQPLQHTPGEDYAYANLGYMLLSLVTEEITGMSHVEVVRERTFASIGVGPEHIEQGRTFEADADPREPWYDGRGLKSTNVFNPTGPLVSRPYGGWEVEARSGQGGLLVDSHAMLHYLANYQVAGAGIGTRRPSWANNTFWQSGSVTGTRALGTQHSNGIGVVVFFNRRSVGDEGDYAVEIRELLLADIADISDWPELTDPSP